MTVAGQTSRLDANEIWEFLFSRTKDAVPEELTNEILADLAAHINKLWIDPLSDQHRREAEAPEGWKLIPRRPTEDMMQAGNYQSSHDSTSADVYSAWVDMWDAAPSPDEYENPSKLERKLAACPSSPASGVRVKATDADVERVARALAADELGMGDPPAVIESIVNHQWPAFAHQARVALSALGEHP